MPAGGHHASLQSWHNRSDQRGRRRTVVVEDKETHLGGFAANHRLFAWTKPRRGAQATVASDSVMASFQGGEGTGRKMARCQDNTTHTFANRNLHTASRTFRMPYMFWRWHPLKGQRRGTEMAPCQMQTGRHSRAPPEALQKRSKRGHKIIAEGWDQPQTQLWCEYGIKTISWMPTLLSANCCTGRKLLPITKNQD